MLDKGKVGVCQRERETCAEYYLEPFMFLCNLIVINAQQCEIIVTYLIKVRFTQKYHKAFMLLCNLIEAFYLALLIQGAAIHFFNSIFISNLMD